MILECHKYIVQNYKPPFKREEKLNESFFVFSEFCPKKKEVFLLLHSLEVFWILLSPVSSIYWKNNNALSAPGPSIFSFSWLTLSVRCLAYWGNNFARFFSQFNFWNCFFFSVNHEWNEWSCTEIFPQVMLHYISFLLRSSINIWIMKWRGEAILWLNEVNFLFFWVSVQLSLEPEQILPRYTFQYIYAPFI